MRSSHVQRQTQSLIRTHDTTQHVHDIEAALQPNFHSAWEGILVGSHRAATRVNAHLVRHASNYDTTQLVGNATARTHYLRPTRRFEGMFFSRGAVHTGLLQVAAVLVAGRIAASSLGGDGGCLGSAILRLHAKLYIFSPTVGSSTKYSQIPPLRRPAPNLPARVGPARGDTPPAPALARPEITVRAPNCAPGAPGPARRRPGAPSRGRRSYRYFATRARECSY